MSDLKTTAEECKIGDCFLVGATEKKFSLRVKRPESEAAGKRLVFNRENRRNLDGLVAAVWRRMS
jgi:hypothetical protein